MDARVVDDQYLETGHSEVSLPVAQHVGDEAGHMPSHTGTALYELLYKIYAGCC